MIPSWAEPTLATVRLRTLGLLKIPMLYFVRPSVVELNDRRCVVKIPLNRRTKNHLGSMYFGALAVGADCAGGLIAWSFIERSKAKISIVFKDFNAEFLKRPQGDVHFICEQGDEIRALVERARASGERENITLSLVATVPSKHPTEPVARFKLTLSVKKNR